MFESIINLTPLSRVLSPDTTPGAIETGEYISVELPNETDNEAAEGSKDDGAEAHHKEQDRKMPARSEPVVKVEAEGEAK